MASAEWTASLTRGKTDLWVLVAARDTFDSLQSKMILFLVVYVPVSGLNFVFFMQPSFDSTGLDPKN
jgi:hypothetical protein